MSSMAIEAEHNPSRLFERTAAVSNYAQAALLLGGFGALLTAVLWPEFGRGAVIAQCWPPRPSSYWQRASLQSP